MEVLVPLVSVASALLIAGFFLALQGIPPLELYSKMLAGSFASYHGISYTIVKTIPLLLCGAGLVLAFKANIWNIGAEGQLLMGAVAATWVALYAMPSAPSYLVIPAMFAFGFIAGALWGLVPGYLKSKLAVNEIITTLMMNYIAIKLVEYLIYGPWRGEEEWGFPITDKFPEAAWLPRIPGTSVHIPTLILALLSAALVYLLLYKTKVGYEARVYGSNPEAARYAGISSEKVILLVMAISGGLAGLAGVGEVAGIHRRLRYPWSISCGYGFAAIIVAFLARLNPLAAIISAIFLGGLFVGGDAVQMAFGLPVGVVNMFNGLMLLCLVSGEFALKYRVRVK